MSVRFEGRLDSRLLLVPAVLVSVCFSGVVVAAQTPNAVSNAAVNSEIPPVRDMKLITPTSGWILAGRKIFWTDTAGQSWKEITPSLTSTQALDSAYFFDADHGWAVVHDPGFDQTQPTVSVARTSDAGKSWRIKELPGDEFFRDGAGNRSSFYFVDSDHGWVIVDKMNNTAHSLSDLFVTKDAGKTWGHLPRPPIAGQIQFFPDSVGWLFGGVNQNELYKTTDGGQTWAQKVMPLPKGLHPYAIQEEWGRGYVTQPSYGVPYFQNEKQAVIEVCCPVKDIANARDLTYKTGDGGNTWTLRTNTPYNGTPVFYGVTVARISRSNGKLVLDRGSKTTAFTLPAGTPKGFWIVKADLTDWQHGWLLGVDGELLELNGANGLSVLIRNASPKPVYAIPMQSAVP